VEKKDKEKKAAKTKKSRLSTSVDYVALED
jgi:hypothetical protein